MVIYDSEFGNTAQVARAIAEGLGSALDEPEEVGLQQIGGTFPDQLAGLDLLVVGSPTQRFRPTSGTSNFIKRIPKHALKGVKVAGFDTRLTEEEIKAHGFLSKMVELFGYAAEPISERLAKKGGEVVMPPEGFTVAGMEGPLSEGELERAKVWGQKIIANA
jgi:flavodoxin